MKRKSTILLALLFVATASFGQIDRGTIYVTPSNSGTQDGTTPASGYKTFKGAMDRVKTYRSSPTNDPSGSSYVIYIEENSILTGVANLGNIYRDTWLSNINLTVEGNNSTFDFTGFVSTDYNFIDGGYGQPAVDNGMITFKNIKFQNFPNGGFIRVNGGFMVEGCEFKNMKSLFALSAGASGIPKLIIKNSIIHDNAATVIDKYNDQLNATHTVTIENSVFYNNTGAYLYTTRWRNHTTLSVSNSTFYNNTNTNYLFDVVTNLTDGDNGSAVFINNTFYGNKGYAISNYNKIPITLENNLIVGASSGNTSYGLRIEGGSGSFTGNNNVIMVNSSAGTIATGSSNTVESSIANVGNLKLGTWDYSDCELIVGTGKPFLPITKGSTLLINTGNTSAPPKDALGTTRGNGTTTGANNDIGAFEFIQEFIAPASITINFEDETLEGFLDGADNIYNLVDIIDGTTLDATFSDKETFEIDSYIPASTESNLNIKITKEGACNHIVNSEPYPLEIPARPEAPDVSCTVGTKDIIGINNSTMEISDDDRETWADCTTGNTTDLENGTYYVRLKATGSSFASEIETVPVLAGGTSITETLEVTPALYPNPASDYVIIKNALGKSVSVYTSLGAKVFETSGLANESISIANFVPGIYLIKVNGTVLRLIKK